MGQLTVDRLGASHPLAVLDPVTREARLEQRAQRILAAFRVMGGSLGVLLTLLDDTHPPLELTLELVLMGGYAVTGVVLLGLLRRPYELDDVRALGRRLLWLDAAVLLSQPPLHGYVEVPQGPSPALVFPFLAGLRGSFRVAWAGVAGITLALMARDVIATQVHDLPSGYDPALVTIALAAVLGVVTAYLVRDAAAGRRLADRATAEAAAMHRVLRAGVGGGADAAGPRMQAELVDLLGTDLVRLELGEDRPAAAPGATSLPLGTAGRTLGHLVVDARVDAPEISLARLADQVSLALQAALVLDREVDLTRRYRDLHRLQSDFVAIASHELRTPVTAIVGAAEMLAQRGDALSPTDREDLRGALVRQSRRLQRLLDDLVVVGRHDAGTLLVEADDVHVGETVEEVVAQLRRPAVDVAGPADTWVRADRARLEQVLSNVLENAFEHGRPPVTVRWVVEGERARILVTDSGPGVAAADRERIFDRFVQAGGIDRHSRGNGLGLAIARDLARAMDGDLQVTEGDGVGARFVITLDHIRRAADVTV